MTAPTSVLLQHCLRDPLDYRKEDDQESSAAMHLCCASSHTPPYSTSARFEKEGAREERAKAKARVNPREKTRKRSSPIPSRFVLRSTIASISANTIISCTTPASQGKATATATATQSSFKLLKMGKCRNVRPKGTDDSRRRAEKAIQRYRRLRRSCQRTPVKTYDVKELLHDEEAKTSLKVLRKLQTKEHKGCRLKRNTDDTELYDELVQHSESTVFLAMRAGETVGTVRLRVPQRREGAISEILHENRDKKVTLDIFDKYRTSFGVRRDYRRKVNPYSTVSLDLAQAVLNTVRNKQLKVLGCFPENRKLAAGYSSFCGGALERVKGGETLHRLDVKAIKRYLESIC